MLRVENLSLTFEKGTINEKKALKRINLLLQPGDFVTVIGSNGAGKSTLFGVIAGNYIPDTGRIFLGEMDVTFAPEYRRARKIGRILQDPKAGTAPSMTVAENLLLAHSRSHQRRRFKTRRQELDYFRQRLRELNLGLEERMETKIGLLSGGQRQAVTLLMATLSPPELLLLDEHTAALDPATADKVLALTSQIVAEHQITTLMITHNISSALTLGNRTLMMDAGEISLDVSGEQRSSMTVPKLLALFKQVSQRDLDDDRILLSSET